MLYWEVKTIEILYLLTVLLLIPLNKVPCVRFAVFTRFSARWCKNNFCVFSESRSIHNQGQFVPLQNFNDSITCLKCIKIWFFKLRTPPIVEIICFKNVWGFVVCGFLMKLLKMSSLWKKNTLYLILLLKIYMYPENMKKLQKLFGLDWLCYLAGNS